VKRLWGVTEDGEKGLLALNDYTEIFDECGAYNGVNGSNRAVIEKGSEYRPWKDALSFLEWFGVQKMPGFGIIIVDRDNLSAYENIPGISNVEDDTNCFDMAKALTISVAFISATLVCINL